MIDVTGATSLTFSEYQAAAHVTAGPYEEACNKMVWDGRPSGAPFNDNLNQFLRLSYVSLGLAGEAGEFPNKVKKVLRDSGGEITPERREAMAAELGDLLWYVAEACSVLGVSLGAVATSNVVKLIDRQAAGTLQGDGDNR